MQVLRLHSKGPHVRQWQLFLIGQGLLAEEVDGVFGTNTEKATMAFQKRRKIKPDGEAGNITIGAAMQLGFKALDDDDDAHTASTGPPARLPAAGGPPDAPAAIRQVPLRSSPHPEQPENIKVLDNWASQHIDIAHLPAVGSPIPARVEFHKLAIPQLEQLWKDWHQAGLLDHVRTWDGSYVPRFIRGSRTQLSNHAFGTAFDINAAFNRLGTIPARLGQPGSVRDMVELANKNGFYWGGHFGGTRTDGMHFEVAKLLP